MFLLSRQSESRRCSWWAAVIRTKRANNLWQCGQGSVLDFEPLCFRLTLPEGVVVCGALPSITTMCRMTIDTKGGVSRAENENGELALHLECLFACDEFSRARQSYDPGGITEALVGGQNSRLYHSPGASAQSF